VIESEYLKSVGARILSEANDLKRTVESMATDLSIDSEDLQRVINGNCTREDTFKIINLIEKIYPVDSSDLLLINDDCQNGILHFSVDKSKKTSRVFNRINRQNKRTPYYDYRDTAMSKLSPFKPEWIKELRIVSDSNPDNPNVAYNNGHFMHQLTFFVGPVNFYYVIDGKKYCKEMSTGDSNYITPYTPHSFTSRDESQEAYIVAITFGGDVRRAQKELYAIGAEKIKKYSLDIRNENKAISQLIQQHMDNENLTKDMISDRVDVDKLLDVDRFKTLSEIEKVADLLNIEPSDLMIPKYNKTHEVVVHKKSEAKAMNYPNNKDKIYKIYYGSRVNKIPNLKSFDVSVLSTNIKEENLFSTSLHSYVYNYGEIDVLMVYINNGEQYTQLLKARDSVYVQPFVKYGFQNNLDKVSSNVFIARVSGGINFCTQKELSYFLDIERVAGENMCWFN
jgi:methylphosphonate synthase